MGKDKRNRGLFVKRMGAARIHRVHRTIDVPYFDADKILAAYIAQWAVEPDGFGEGVGKGVGRVRKVKTRRHKTPRGVAGHGVKNAGGQVAQLDDGERGDGGGE